MQLEFPRDVEASIQSQAIAAGFQTTEEYILNVLKMESPATDIPDESPEQWLEKFNALVGKQISRNPKFDDSRDSIYLER